MGALCEPYQCLEPYEHLREKRLVCALSTLSVRLMNIFCEPYERFVSALVAPHVSLMTALCEPYGRRMEDLREPYECLMCAL